MGFAAGLNGFRFYLESGEICLFSLGLLLEPSISELGQQKFFESTLFSRDLRIEPSSRIHSIEECLQQPALLVRKRKDLEGVQDSSHQVGNYKVFLWATVLREHDD